MNTLPGGYRVLARDGTPIDATIDEETAIRQAREIGGRHEPMYTRPMRRKDDCLVGLAPLVPVDLSKPAWK